MTDEQVERYQNNSAAGSKFQSKFHPATLKQKIWLAIGLVVGLAVILSVWVVSVTKVERYLRNETRVSWAAPGSAAPRPGPPSFWYDPEHKELVFVGAIDAKQKFELMALFSSEVDGQSRDAVTLYQAAIDALAFKSNQNLYGVLLALLLLGGISGALGAQLRSFTAFVGNACYTEKLDVITWWPYYAVRPFTGFILGIVVVAIVQAGFLSVGAGPSSGTLWWVALAILAGYSDDEFTQKLRDISKTAFGQRDPSSRKKDQQFDGDSKESPNTDA